MPEKEKEDSIDVAGLLKDLPQKDHLRIFDIILGLKAARFGLPEEEEQEKTDNG